MEEEKRKYKLLLVDDDSFLVDMYSLKFTTAGHELKPAFGAKEALDILRGGYSPDAIIVDIVMPEMDGLALMEKIREEHLGGAAALIVLSNQGEKQDIEKAKELGAVGHIIKANAIPSEVLTMVVALVEKHRASSASAAQT
jgi:CheY-like chemotaxis protein